MSKGRRRSLARVGRQAGYFFPLLSGIAGLLVLDSFGLPLFLSRAVTIDRHAEQVTQKTVMQDA